MGNLDCACIKQHLPRETALSVDTPTVVKTRLEALHSESTDDFNSGSIRIQSAARGYFVRKASRDFRNATHLLPQLRIRQAEATHGTRSLTAPVGDGVAVQARPASSLPRGGFYLGEWNAQGQRHGCGKEIGADGSWYVGHFQCDRRSGHGWLVQPSGDQYEGELAQDQPHGTGVEYLAAGQVYWGHFAHGTRHGEGTLLQTAESLPSFERLRHLLEEGAVPHSQVYKGAFEQGLRSGYGELTYEDGRVYKGHWKADLQHGEGEFDSRRGVWRLGKRLRWVK